MASQVQNKDAAIQVVLRRVLVLNLLVALGKLAVGFLTGALSIIADGFHSLIDAISNLVAIIAQAIAARPPDEDHPYGHRRFESIATFIIGGFLMLVAFEVLQAAIDRITNEVAPEIIPASFVVLIGTLLINIFVVWYERGRGKAYESRILLADAAQTGTDVLVTLSVIGSLILTQAGLIWVDGVVALIIVVLIGRMGWQIIWESTSVLVDTAALSPAAIEKAVLQVPEASQVLRVRSRGSENEVYVDLDVQVRPELTADHAHSIALAIRDQVRDSFPQVKEVQISFAPHREGSPDYFLIARAAADGMGLGVHEVIPILMDDGVTLEMHVEVPMGLSLATAHQKVTALENALMDQDSINNVITHIEPQGTHGAPITHSQRALQMRDHAVSIARELYPDADWHEPAIRLMPGGYALTMHCMLPGSISVEEAHQIAEQVETRIRVDMPVIQRVTIHTEPIEA